MLRAQAVSHQSNHPGQKRRASGDAHPNGFSISQLGGNYLCDHFQYDFYPFTGFLKQLSLFSRSPMLRRIRSFMLTFQRNCGANCSLGLLAYKDKSHKVNLVACNKRVSVFSLLNGIWVLDRSVQNADWGLQTEYNKRFVLFNAFVVVEEMQLNPFL